MKYSFILIGIVILATACHKKAPEKTLTVPDQIPVKVMPIRQDTVTPVFEAVGYFTTDDETALSFKNGGIINRIHVQEGDFIRKGQLLATVIGEEVNTGLSQAETAYEKARRDYQRADALYQDSVATQEQMQNAGTAMELARQRVELARTDTRYTGIYALENGYVLERYLNEGQLAGPGTPVLLVNGAGQSQWIFQVSLSESQWATVEEGDPAEIITDVAPHTSFQASIIQKSKTVNPGTGGLNVKLSVRNPDKLPLASGVFGKATIRPSRGQVVWSVPYDAVLDGDSEYGYVFTTHDKAFASKVKVRITGLSTGEVWIDQGLDSAGYLIVAGSAYLNDGAAITLQHLNN